MTIGIVLPETERHARGIGLWGQSETGHPDIVLVSVALGGPSLLVNAKNTTAPLAPLAESPKTPLLVDTVIAPLPHVKFRSD